ncbi:MAG TPA: oligosaccharide flippase family protein [Thermoanaerobaculia bacterium]|nr:oligosaccharide flippase family protein [Thermoanaerobaculia bacterium]HXK68154.1 oligosaccharide flippase family protein [Thermoanaerobaculia bacterium]
MLTPDDFGIFGVALLALSTFESLSRTGFEAALIHKTDPIETSLDTAWTLQLLRSFLVGAFLFLLSAPLAAFFRYPGPWQSYGLLPSPSSSRDLQIFAL